MALVGDGLYVRKLYVKYLPCYSKTTGDDGTFVEFLFTTVVCEYITAL